MDNKFNIHIGLNTDGISVGAGDGTIAITFKTDLAEALQLAETILFQAYRSTGAENKRLHKIADQVATLAAEEYDKLWS